MKLLKRFLVFVGIFAFNNGYAMQKEQQDLNKTLLIFDKSIAAYKNLTPHQEALIELDLVDTFEVNWKDNQVAPYTIAELIVNHPEVTSEIRSKIILSLQKIGNQKALS